MSHPSPAQMPGSRPAPSPAPPETTGVDPTELAAQIGEITDRLDEIAGDVVRDPGSTDPDDTEAVGREIAALDATADLVDGAHGLLTAALDRLDRV
ncbi:hypothetical protein ACXVUM_15920 [Williamsia sp. SKLECPSW1]